MNKTVEYLAVAVVSIFLFMLLASLLHNATTSSIIKDCNASGYSRIGYDLLKCEVIQSTSKKEFNEQK